MKNWLMRVLILLLSILLFISPVLAISTVYCDWTSNAGNPLCAYTGHWYDHSSRDGGGMVRDANYWDIPGDADECSGNNDCKYEEEDAFATAGINAEIVSLSRIDVTVTAGAMNWLGAYCPNPSSSNCNVFDMYIYCEDYKTYDNDPCFGTCNTVTKTDTCTPKITNSYDIFVYANTDTEDQYGNSVDRDVYASHVSMDIACVSDSDCTAGMTCEIASDKQSTYCDGTPCDYSPTCNDVRRTCINNKDYEKEDQDTACYGYCDGTWDYVNTYACSSGQYCSGSKINGYPCYSCSTACDGVCQSSNCYGTDPDCTSSGGVYECCSDSQCGTYEKCSSKSCTAKTCSELGKPKTCDWTAYSLGYSECNPLGYDGDPTKCFKFGDTYCYDFTDTCTSGEYCDENSVWDAKCTAYECTIGSVSWDQTTATEGDSVGITVQGSYCDGETVSFEVYENDCWGIVELNETNATGINMTEINISGSNSSNFSEQGLCNDLVNVMPVSVTFSGNYAYSSWNAEYYDDISGNPEYYVHALYGAQDVGSSNKLTVSEACPDSDSDGWTTCAGDCNDGNDQVYPGATEVCNGVDDNCVNGIDEGVTNACGTCGECYLGGIDSVSPLSFVAGTDFYITVTVTNDGDAGDISVEPTAIPSGWDIDDGVIDGDNQVTHYMNTGDTTDFDFQITAPNYDDSGTVTFYAFWDGIFSNHNLDTQSYTITSSLDCDDYDGDGYGTNGAASCTYSGTDCDNWNDQIYPGATEVCNGVDDNCVNGIDEGFDLLNDPNNCGSCGNVCSVDEFCSAGNCVSTCGDDVCSAGEYCPKDCIHVVSFVNPPSVVNSSEPVDITVRFTNIGDVTMNTGAEVAIAPTSWNGTTFTIQSASYTPKCCAGNDYYAAYNLSLAPGATWEDVAFTIIPPDPSSVDDCRLPTDPLYSAWDDSFTLLAGTYDSCGGSYNSAEFRSINVVNPSCPNGLDGSTIECSCIADEECGVNQYCDTDTGACMPDPVCTIPDGSSDTCQCFSDTDCTILNESLRCSFIQDFNPCVPINYENQCNIINQTVCIDNGLYRCEQQEYYKDWVHVLGCSFNELCDSQVNQCVPMDGYDLIIDHAPSGVSVNKQPYTIVEVNIKVDGPINSSWVLEYDSTKLNLISGSACQTNTYSQGDNKCYFEVISLVGESTNVRFGNDAQRINIVGNDLTIVYVTEVSQLYRRYKDNNSVELMLAKIYEEAGRNEGVVYDMGVQFAFNSGYGSPHPFDRLFKEYSEDRNFPNMLNNNYSIEISKFLQEYASYAEHIVIVGDDFVIPHRRETYSIRAGSLPEWLRPWYNTIKYDAKYIRYLNAIPTGGVSLLIPPDMSDPGKYLPDDIVIKNMYTDQNLAQREFDKSYESLDLVFSSDDAVRTTEAKIILPTTVTPEMRVSIDNLKVKLVSSGLVENMGDFQELDGAGLNCNDFNEFGDWWFFDFLDVPIVIGTPETNPALSCYPIYSDGEFEDVISIEPSAWNGEGSAVILNTNDPSIVDVFADNIINGNNYRDMHGRGYKYFHDGIQVISLVLIPISFGTSAAIGGTAEAIIWGVDLTVAAIDAADTCYFRTMSWPNSTSEYFYCAISGAPVGAVAAGRAFRVARVNMKVSRLVTKARLIDDASGEFYKAANKFIQSSGEAKYILEKVPEEEFERFLRMIQRGMSTAGDTAQVGTKFGESLTKVIQRANLKRALFQKNPQLLDTLGDVVARHAHESDDVLDAIAKISSRKAESAKSMLSIIDKSDSVWTKAQLEKINTFEDNVLKQMDEYFGSIPPKSSVNVMRGIRHNALTNLPADEMEGLVMIGTVPGYDQVKIVMNSKGKLLMMKTYSQELERNEIIKNKVIQGVAAVMDKGTITNKKVILKSRLTDPIPIGGLGAVDGDLIEHLDEVAGSTSETFESALTRWRAATGEIETRKFIEALPYDIRRPLEENFILDLFIGQKDANSKNQLFAGLIMDGSGNIQKADFVSLIDAGKSMDMNSPNNVFLRHVEFDILFRSDAGFVNDKMYKRLVYAYKNNPNEIIDVLEPAVEKLRHVKRSDFEAIYQLDSLTDAEKIEFQFIGDILFGVNGDAARKSALIARLSENLDPATIAYMDDFGLLDNGRKQIILNAFDFFKRNIQ